MHILISGFEPFGDHDVNPSETLINRAKKSAWTFAEIDTMILPVAFAEGFQRLSERIAATSPDAVVALGVSDQIDGVRVEKVAINFISARIPDNRGRQPMGRRVMRGAPDAHFSTLPIQSMIESCAKKGLPVDVSYSAGTYVCNELMFRLLDLCKNTKTRAGFIHLPRFSVLEEELQLSAVKTMLQTLSNHS